MMPYIGSKNKSVMLALSTLASISLPCKVKTLEEDSGDALMKLKTEMSIEKEKWKSRTAEGLRRKDDHIRCLKVRFGDGAKSAPM